MTDLSRAAVPGAVRQTAAEPRHPSTFAPATFVFLIVLCLFGAVIGVQLILHSGGRQRGSGWGSVSSPP